MGAEEKEGFSATCWLGNERGVSCMGKRQLKKEEEVKGYRGNLDIFHFLLFVI